MKAGGCPYRHCPIPMLTWHFGATGPFLRVTHAHYTIPVPWTLGLLWSTSPCPGCPLLDTHLSTAMLPAGPWTPAPLQVGFVPSSPHQQQNDFLLVNLTNPRTNITLIPGSLGWDSLLPPIIHSHHAFHIHSIHTLGPADPYSFYVYIYIYFFFHF